MSETPWLPSWAREPEPDEHPSCVREADPDRLWRHALAMAGLPAPTDETEVETERARFMAAFGTRLAAYPHKVPWTPAGCAVAERMAVEAVREVRA